jgi:hypothetical protein
MRVVTALLGLAAVTLYGSYSYFAPGSNRPLQVAELTEIVTGPLRTAAAARPVEGSAAGETAPAPVQRVFSPQQPLLPPPAVRVAEAPKASVVPSRRSDPFDTVGPVRSLPDRTQVQLQPKLEAVSPRVEAPAPAATAAKSGTTRPTTDEGRIALIRDLQRELKRVGCYDGESTGTWGAATRRAMSEFTGRVNASLPTDSPDYILLALVRGHPGQACGTACAGGRLGADGRCQSREMLAQAPAARAAPTAPPARTETPPLDDKGLETRAAAMASQLANAPFPQRPRRITETGAFPTAAGTPQPAAPVVRSPAASRTAVAESLPPPAVATPAPAPLPGRMAIGAPVAGASPAPAFPAQPAPGGRLAALPEVTGGQPPTGWSQQGALPEGALEPLPEATPGALRPKRAKQPRADRPRNTYNYADRGPSYFGSYDRPPSSSAGRQGRNSGSLKSNSNVRDFFFGPNRTSF